MLHYWQREIDNLKKLILSLGALVEEQIQRAMLALERRDAELANEVISKDREIDSLEIVIEEECLKILALYQPVAKELRFVVAVLKMNNDLERMGDLAANIAKRARYLSKKDGYCTTILYSYPNRGGMAGMLLKVERKAGGAGHH